MMVPMVEHVTKQKQEDVHVLEKRGTLLIHMHLFVCPECFKRNRAYLYPHHTTCSVWHKVPVVLYPHTQYIRIIRNL